MIAELVIDPAVAIKTRRVLQAAIRRLQPLEHPAGWKATHDGAALLREARALIEQAAALLTEAAR